MKLNRRNFMVTSAALTATSAVPAAAALAGDWFRPDTVVWDSRVPGLGASLPASKQRIDLATIDDKGWFRIGELVQRGATVSGYTDWSSFVVLRDAFRERGLRLQAREQRLDYHNGRSLFVWQMA